MLGEAPGNSRGRLRVRSTRGAARKSAAENIKIKYKELLLNKDKEIYKLKLEKNLLEEEILEQQSDQVLCPVLYKRFPSRLRRVSLRFCNVILFRLS